MMKLFTTLVIAFLITISGFSQTHTATIKTEAETYYNHMTAMNLDGVLDYMHPKMFEMASREQMKAGMEQMFNSPQMKIEFISNDVTSISDDMEEDGITYAVVFYNSKMRMTFLTEKDKPAEEQKAYLELMKSTMASQFGAENVSVDEDTLSLVINNDSSMFAIKDPSFNGWKFLGNEENMTAFVNSVVPERVRTALLKS